MQVGNIKRHVAVRSAVLSMVEGLEGRQLMANSPLTVAFASGRLTVTGTATDDAILITRTNAVYTISNGTWSTTRTAAVTAILVNAKAGRDTITLDSSVTVPATLQGDIGADTIVAGAGATSLSGGAGDDSLTGGGANDILSGGLGNDTVAGGAGNDILDYSDHTVAQGITISYDASTTAGMTGETDTFATDFESLRGGAGNDSITGTGAADWIDGLGGADTINGAGGNDKIYGNTGNDSLLGGDGNDSLYGGAGNDNISGGEGDDDIISVGGGALSTLAGGNGLDSFWLDSATTETVTDTSSDETTYSAVHRINTFEKLKGTVVSKELTGQALPDPTVLSASHKYFNQKDKPLFASSGPAINDIRQGSVGDCYFLAQIGSLAGLTPTLIKQAIVSFGDGTFGVRLIRAGVTKFYRIDADLPGYSASSLAYAGFGAENSTWAPLLEKAWAFARTGAGTYASIASGWMGEVATAFGKSSTWANVSGDMSILAQTLQTALAAGKSVTLGTLGTQPGGSLMVGGHAYTVMSVDSDGAGSYTITVRNPWHVDGYTCADGSNDGYVTLTLAQFAASVQAYNVATL